MDCGEQVELKLTPNQLTELLAKPEIKLPCTTCNAVTQWFSTELDRRVTPRRSNNRVKVEMPIRVRSEKPGDSFTEVGTTLNASRDGACFTTKHALSEGMEVFVLLPYTEGEDLPETRARIIRVEQKDGQYEVGIEFRR
jgi:hypothetical protein